MTTVSVNNYFTACKSCIAMRASNNKFSCRVDKKSEIAFKQFLYPGRKKFLYPGIRIFLTSSVIFSCIAFSAVFSAACVFVFWQNKFIMLGTDDNSIYAKRLIVIIIFNSYLRFAVGSEVFHMFSFTPYFCKLLKKAM